MNRIYTKHAKLRMEERNITEEDIDEVLENARAESHKGNTIIREYKDVCVVFTVDSAGETIKILTVYHPNKSLEEAIGRIPAPHDWWHKDDEQVFVNQAYFLVDKGLTEKEIIDHLTEIYLATCGEFGE